MKFWKRKKQGNSRDPKVQLDPMADPTSIGNLILKHKMIDSEKFAEILERYREVAENRYLGQFMVEQTDIGLTQGQLDFLLLKQQTLRKQQLQDSNLDHSDVMRAIRIAQSVQDQFADSVDALADATSVGKVKA